MIPFRFGPRERQLYGVFHPLAGGQRGPGTGVLLCNPFGQEAVRLHRFYRVLAERLSRAGVPVLRFDYFGTGESAGDDEQGDLAGWVLDIAHAHTELLQRTRSTRVVWVGARLGATLAAMASAKVQRAPEMLLLWEPVTDGSRYLKELASAHARATLNIWSVDTQPALLDDAAEMIGFGMSLLLRQQLEQQDAAVFAGTRTDRVVIIDNPMEPSAASLGKALDEAGVNHQTTYLQHSFDWTSEEALNTALVPTEALQLLTTHMDVSP